MTPDDVENEIIEECSDEEAENSEERVVRVAYI
jgi:hypothetical protein